MDMQNTIRNLELRGFDVKHFATGREAAEYLAGEIRDTEVGFGGCTTAAEMNLYEILSENNTCYWHWKQQPAVDAIAKANAAPVYITSANAIAETGEIINIDGRGNRLAAQVYGIGKKVYIIAGANKIAPDFNSAVERARQVACVTRGKDFPSNTPCKVDGKCHDCRSRERFCNGMLVLWGPMIDMGGMEVVLIDESLGY